MDSAQIKRRVAELMEIPVQRVELQANFKSDSGHEIDMLLKADDLVLAIECKRTASSAVLNQAARQLRMYARELNGAIPMLVVPYMGETGSRICEELGVSWLDLSGNARIKTPGLNISWLGRPNRFKYESDTKSIFAPKVSRLVRWFLMNPHTHATQREVARAIELDEGYLSHAIAHMLKAGYIVRDADRRLAVRDPELLLDDWRQAYEFSKHRVVRGHVLARSGDALAAKLATTFEDTGQRHAFTGLVAAWQIDRFAGFRLATVYLEHEPEDELLETLGFRHEDRGANTWLVVPKDDGVFQGSSVVDGLRCVHPVQAYVDLQALPERAQEASEHLHERILETFRHAR